MGTAGRRDGDGAPEILAAGGTPAAEGRFSILKAIEGRLEEQAGVALASAIGRLPFAVGDLDGDGDPEILLGTATYERSIRVYTWRRGASALELRSLTPARGDVARILLQDLDADGTPEAIAGAGPWGAYALQVYAWRGNKLVLRSQVTAGTIGSADEVPGGEGWEILAAVLWEPEQVRPLEHLLGEDRFRKTYRPPGLYSARPDGQGGMGLTPVLAGEWANISSGLWKTAIVRGRRGPQAWLIGKDDPPATGPASSATRTWSGAVLERSTSGLWTPVVKFTHPDSVLPYLGAADLDGDGEDELLLSSDQGLLIRGLGRRDPPPPAVGRRQGSPNRSGEGEEAVTRSLLDAARDAEQAGLWEEALEVYRRVGERPGRGSTSLDIFGGVRRCLAALGCYEELSEAAKRTSAEHPGREAEILTPPIEALCEARRWGIAADLVALRGQSAGLDASARVAARVEERRLRDLEALPARLALCGSDGAALDWLVSSPLAVHINGESLTFSSSSDTREFCVTAVRMDGPGAEISATAEPGALDWATEVGLSLHYEPPWVKMSGVSGEQFNWATHEAAEIGFRSSGSTSFPRRRVTLVANGPAWGFEQILLEDRGGLPRRIRLTLQPLPSPSRLYGRVAWEDRDDRKAGLFEAAGPASSPRGGRVWVGLSGSGSHSGPGFWGTVLFAGLEFRSPRTSDVPIPYTAVSALDHLLLANGRQVWGRSDEARRLYDLAVRLSESEAAREERLIAEGLPSSWTGGTAYAHWRWVHVDALMYRGLLRSNLGDSAGAAEDLRRAWKRGPERVAQLTARFARPLLKRPMESEALAALWLRGEGEETPPPDAEAVLERIRATYDATGEVDEWIEALFGRFGYRVRHGLTVKRTEAPEGPTRSGPQAGDRVESADHAPIRTRSDWTTARMRAAREGADAMRVIFRRGDQTVEVSVPIERPDIELEEKATVEGPDAVGR
ncbi:MAG: VCBS repeat-containing protein [Planctomycetes bacterium]|nr:VCBS repeat-containing protein [Planctomycetota bacterium]